MKRKPSPQRRLQVEADAKEGYAVVPIEDARLLLELLNIVKASASV